MSENLNGDVDRWIEWIKDCKYLPETDLKQLCTIISEIFLEESNVQPIFSPVTICGDLHGQLTCVVRVRHHHRLHRHQKLSRSSIISKTESATSVYTHNTSSKNITL